MAGLGSTILPCCLYFIYAAAYVGFCLLTQLHISGDIYQAVVEPFVVAPWRQNPDKFVRDVSNGEQVYQWLETVFLNQVYKDVDELSDDYYCSEAYPCRLNEGPSRRNETCTRNLYAGEYNCPSFMGSSAGCCTSCIGDQCPNTTLQLAGCSVDATTSVPNLAENCADEMPSWLPYLSNWPQDTGFDFPDPLASCPNDNSGDVFKFCPERLPKHVRGKYGETSRPVGPRRLTMANFNEVVFGRMTLKRIKLVSDTAAAFTNAYPLQPEGGTVDPFVPTDNDNKTSFGDIHTYSYEEDKGFRSTGGFVHYLDFNKSQRQIRNEIADLRDNYWFDLRQGTFVLEVLIYNGNYETFLYVQFVFQHLYNGMGSVSVEAYPLNMSFLNAEHAGEFYTRYVMVIIMVLGLFYFVKSELDDASADSGAYISNPVNVLHLVSMSLSFIGLVYWFITVYSYTFTTIGLPLPETHKGKVETFQALVDLASNMHIFFGLSSINICLIIMRSISLLATMTPYSSVIFATLYHARNDMASFMLVFTTLFIGFMFGGFYLCGTRVRTFNSLAESFVTCLQMVMSYSNYNNIVRGDATVGIGYFYCFHLFFIITQNLLLSIICGAYNEERRCLEDPGVAAKYPLRRFVRAAKTAGRDVGRTVTRLTSGIVQFLFGNQGGSAIRINNESLWRLTDQRAGSRPISRTVEYVTKNDDDFDRRDPNKDMKLVGKPPLYRDGLMNFYVEEAVPEGLAAENGIVADFRLVCIKRQGTEDRREFRDPVKFLAAQGSSAQDPDGYGGDPQNMLIRLQESLPVVLEFEGKIDMCSFGCLGTAFCVLATCLFFYFATRVTDSYYMFSTQAHILKKTYWNTYNPTRQINLETSENIGHFGGWIDNAVITKTYSCVNIIDNPPPCTPISASNSVVGNIGKFPQYVRPNYVLYAGPSGIPMEGPVNGVQFTPPSVQGQSLGYIPWSGVPGGNPSWNSQMHTVPRMADLNVAFMQNNFVRITLQLTCFKKNTVSQWERGVPYILHDVAISSSACATDDCMRRTIKDLQETKEHCYTEEGTIRNSQEFEGTVSGVKYKFTEEGTYNDLGGISLGLGATQFEAAKVASIASSDALFMGRSVSSVVVEYVIYNANLDAFSYTSVLVNMLPTGLLTKHISVTTFPLKVFSMGSGERNQQQTTVCFVLLGLFVFCVLVSIVSFLWDMSIEYRINREKGKSCIWFIPSFFADSWWNFLDLTGITVNIFTIVSLMQYIFIEQESWWDTWTTSEFKFSKTVTEGTKDPFEKFSRAAFHYRCFTTGGGFSTLLICIRSIKYFVIIQQMQLVLSTIITSFWELYYMLVILCLSLMAFAFMFHTRFAVLLPVFQNLTRSFCELYLYMVGQFDTEATMRASPTYFVISFTCVQFVFYFLLSNMFLATLVYKWKYTRKDAQEDVQSTFARIYKSLPCFKSRKGVAKGDDVHKRPLDKNFWKSCSVLNYLDRFDEYGKIRDNVGKPVATEGTNGLNGEVAKKNDLEDIFRRAHMEIASKMCRSTAARQVDRGGGMGNMLEDGGEDGANYQEEEVGDYVGIIEEEDKVEENTATKIKADLEEKFKQEDSHAWEIWLDALTTVLEDHGLLEKLQKFFLPQPMIKPRSSQEWGHFDQRKVKMEKRLDLFLGLMMEETYIAHYRYLRESAKTKQKVLKQQSLVLADYLEQLDNTIKELQEEIKVLDRRNADMRTHVQPLL
mmetsp:Transcript_159476/g.290921  ORF Transcript_159476/g.290921 Transcript_159476/m.290921 type:complete len:1713 (-) Transcript_159476:64-5202(-)